MQPVPTRGRRPRGAPTQQEILTAARAIFAESGFAAATITEIAQQAGVDRSVVTYFFGSKEKLFQAVVAEGPLDQDRVAAQVRDGKRGKVGRRLVVALISAAETEEALPGFVAFARSAATTPELRGAFEKHLITQVDTDLAGLELDQRKRRVALVATVIQSILTTRLVYRTQASALPAEALGDIYGPVIQKLLFDPLPRKK